ncbi:hypothetical protein [Providencia hangzhouensis]|uniref:hypothetical protein n=1 Tax=Providencia hangzhouensis TaxID=3031799 RepID=UPI0034DD3861
MIRLVSCELGAFEGVHLAIRLNFVKRGRSCSNAGANTAIGAFDPLSISTKPPMLSSLWLYEPIDSINCLLVFVPILNPSICISGWLGLKLKSDLQYGCTMTAEYF